MKKISIISFLLIAFTIVSSTISAQQHIPSSQRSREAINRVMPGLEKEVTFWKNLKKGYDFLKK